MPNNRSKIYDGKVYYGSSSSVATSDGTVTVGFAGVWDGTPGSAGWTTLDGGIQSGYGRGISVVNSSHIYVFGKFSSIGATNNLAHTGDFNIAKWNGTQWQALGALGATNDEIKDVVYDADRDILYAVGEFTTIMGVPANYVARFQGGVWSALQGGANSNVHSCQLDGSGNLYIAGIFGQVSNASAVATTMRIARWNYALAQWESVLPGSVTGTAWDLTYDAVNDQMYAAGSFGFIGSVPQTKLVARYDVAANTWSSIGDFSAGGDSTIYDIEYVDGRLYAVGNFDTYGNDAAVFDGSTWQGLGVGDGYSLDPSQTSFVPIDLAVDSNSNLYINRNAGGFYILANGDTVWRRVDTLSGPVNIGLAPQQQLGSSQPATLQHMCFHGDSVIGTVNGPNRVCDLKAGDVLVDDSGLQLRVTELSVTRVHKPVRFYRLNGDIRVTGLHRIRYRHNRRSRVAFLARLPDQVERVNCIYHIHTDGPKSVYYVPVDSQYSVEVWGKK